MTQEHERDIEKDYPIAEFMEKACRLANSLKSGQRFQIWIAGWRILVPVSAILNLFLRSSAAE